MLTGRYAHKRMLLIIAYYSVLLSIERSRYVTNVVVYRLRESCQVHNTLETLTMVVGVLHPGAI